MNITIVGIEGRWLILWRKAIFGVRDNETGFADGTIPYEHYLDVSVCPGSGAPVRDIVIALELLGFSVPRRLLEQGYGARTGRHFTTRERHPAPRVYRTSDDSKSRKSRRRPPSALPSPLVCNKKLHFTRASRCSSDGGGTVAPRSLFFRRELELRGASSASWSLSCALRPLQRVQAARVCWHLLRRVPSLDCLFFSHIANRIEDALIFKCGWRWV